MPIPLSLTNVSDREGNFMTYKKSTAYEDEILKARIEEYLPAIVHFPPAALHRIEVFTTNASVGATVVETTNDNDDDGYPDGEWVSWESTFGTADAAFKHAGKCRVGMSGVIVTVIHNGEEIR